MEDRTACRHRLSKFLLRRGLRWGGGRKAWTHAHRQWLRGVSFEQTSAQVVLDGYLLALEQVEARVKHLEEQLEKLAGTQAYREPVGWLCCFRGIKVVTAMTLVTELHGFARFHSPRQLMSYLGLTPSEESSGEPRAVQPRDSLLGVLAARDSSQFPAQADSLHPSQRVGCGAHCRKQLIVW